MHYNSYNYRVFSSKNSLFKIVKYGIEISRGLIEKEAKAYIRMILLVIYEILFLLQYISSFSSNILE